MQEPTDLKDGHNEFPNQIPELGKELTVRNAADEKLKADELSIAYKAISDYKHALDVASIVAVTDPGGIIKHVNDNFCKISKYSREELIGQDHRIINSGYHSKEFMQSLWTTISSGKIWKGDIKNKAKDGTFFWVDTTIVPFMNEQGKPYQYETIRSDITERKKLEESHTLCALIVNSTDDAVLSKDINGNITSWNKGAEKQFGYSSSEIIGKPISILIPSHLLAEEQQIMTKIKNGEIVDQYETERIKKSGETIFVSLTISPIKDVNGNVVGSSKISRDITEIKKAENELIESEQKYRSFFENSMDGILLTITDGAIIAANPAACKMFKMTEEEICKAGRMGIVDPEDTRVLKAIKERQLTGKIKAEVTLLRKDGSKFPAEITSSVFTNGRGEMRTSMIIRDITERKQAEVDNTFKAELLNTIQQSVVATDENGVVTYWNKAAENMYGWKTEDAVGKKIENLTFSNKNQEEAVDTITSLKQMPTQENEYWVHRKDGSVFPVSIGNSPILDSDGRLSGFIAISSDITERKKTEQQVIDSERKYRQIVETAQEGIWIMDENGITTFANKKMCDLLEYTAEEILGRTSLSFRKDENPEAFFQRIEMRKRGISETHQTVFYSKSRKEIYTKISTNPFFDYAGNFIGSLAMVTDITDLKKAEEEKEFEKRNKEALINNTDDLIWSVSNDFKLIAANKAFLTELSTSFELNLKEADNLMLEQFISGDFLDIWKGFYQRALSGEKFTEEILSPLAQHDRNVWSEIIFNPIYKDDRVVAVACFSRNITEKKIGEQKLRESEALLAEAQRLSDLGSWNFDFLSNQLTWSDQLYKVFDTDRERFDGTHTQFLKMIVEDDRELALQTSRHTQQTGEPFAITYRIITTTGKTRTIQEHGYGIKDNDGKIIRLFGTAQNITDRVQAENESRFQASLLNTIGQAAIATDKNGIINYWNQAAEDIYGWTKEEALGQSIVDLTPSEATYEQAIQIMEELKKGQTWSGEFKLRKKDGTNFPAQVTNSPIYNEHNILSGIIGISSDITERKKLEDLLDKTNRLARIGNWEVDIDKGTVYWSSITREIHEGDPGSEPDLGKGIDYYKEGENRDRIRKCVKACITDGTPWNEELQIVTLKGNLKWVGTIGRAEFRGGRCTKVYGSLQDIDEKKKAEVEIKKINTELHELSMHLQNIREEERIQIARDIHDELGQQLTGLKMDVYVLNRKLVAPNEAVQEKIKEITALIDDAVTSVRKIASNLRPNILDDLGLVAALEWHSKEVETRFGITVNFVAGENIIDIGSSISTGLFRIYQEALTNAVRHANAHLITGSLLMLNDTIILEIKDDGKGMDVDKEYKGHFGMLGIKERVFILDGKYEFKSEPGKGTSLFVSIPMKNNKRIHAIADGTNIE